MCDQNMGDIYNLNFIDNPDDFVTAECGDVFENP